ncbi:MAG: aminoacyl-histidine dipeptidase [Monoglobales bacterium]
MNKLNGLHPENVFKFFEEISLIPRGSGNMKQISDYCEEFAKEHSLRIIRDDADNIIIFKNGTAGYENAQPVILQGHLDMVCQKEPTCTIDFERDGLDIYVDGDYIKARGTTLGADNGIAVAMVLAILASDNIAHPPIEAIFTTDEEIGMIGASKLDVSEIKGKRMINIDSEEQDLLTTSCAGGMEYKLSIPIKRRIATGSKISFSIAGLKGGHSGVEIDKKRVNASILMGRILNHLRKFEFDIISITGGDKSNAITNACMADILTKDAEKFISALRDYEQTIKNEIDDREPDFIISIETFGESALEVFETDTKETLISALVLIPNGIIEMSATIDGLVETSLNLGILKTDKENITLVSGLRSSKLSALDALEEKLGVLADTLGLSYKTSGKYLPWEYNRNSVLQKLYIECFEEKFGYPPKVVAIHAGLECGVLASKISGLDSISIGPELFDIHTVNERVSIKSVREMYQLILDVLKKMDK